jgi:hypothetical protein
VGEPGPHFHLWNGAPAVRLCGHWPMSIVTHTSSCFPRFRDPLRPTEPGVKPEEGKWERPPRGPSQ